MINWFKREYAAHRSFFWYAVAGVANTALDYLVYVLLLAVAGAPIEVCQAAGHISGVILSFIMNRNISFRQARGQSAWGQGVRFILINIVTLLVSVALISVFSRLLGVNEYLVKLPVTVFIALISYTGYKLFVFKGDGNKDNNDGSADNDR